MVGVQLHGGGVSWWQLQPGLPDHVGRRPGQDPRQRPAPDPVARQDLRLRLPVQERLPLREDRHAAQARPRQLRRHCHRLLLILPGSDARRDRLRVPRQPQRRPLHAAHQRVHPGDGQQGDAVQAVVRPHAGLPHLLHPLEPQAHHLHGGRHADQGLPEPRIPGHRLPEEPADEDLLQPLERRRLGHQGRAGEDRLVQGAVPGRVQGLQRRRLHAVPERLPVLRRLAAPPSRRVVEPRAGPDQPTADAVGAEELHDLQLLHRPQALPPGPATGVLRRLTLIHRPDGMHACMDEIHLRRAESKRWIDPW